MLSPIVAQSTNYTDLLNRLGMKISGGVHRLITMRIKEYEIDTSHFTGHSWNKGKNKNTDDRIKKQSFKVSTPYEKVFCKNSGFTSSKLYGRLLELGWENKCHGDDCGITDWKHKPIRFHVDHINGNHSDHRIDNLRFLCPNCHQQTETWGYKNKT